jgi:hypothetical protein
LLPSKSASKPARIALNPKYGIGRKMPDISTTSPGATCNISYLVIILNISSELFNAHENI